VALILNNSIPQITQKYPITNGQEAVFQDSKTNMEITQLNKKSFALIAFGLSISKFVRILRINLFIFLQKIQHFDQSTLRILLNSIHSSFDDPVYQLFLDLGDEIGLKNIDRSTLKEINLNLTPKKRKSIISAPKKKKSNVQPNNFVNFTQEQVVPVCQVNRPHSTHHSQRSINQQSTTGHFNNSLTPVAPPFSAQQSSFYSLVPLPTQQSPFFSVAPSPTQQSPSFSAQQSSFYSVPSPTQQSPFFSVSPSLAQQSSFYSVAQQSPSFSAQQSSFYSVPSPTQQSPFFSVSPSLAQQSPIFSFGRLNDTEMIKSEEYSNESNSEMSTEDISPVTIERIGF